MGSWLARRQWLDALARKSEGDPRLRVWTWGDLWDEVGRREANPPLRLAPAGARRVLIEAVAMLRGRPVLSPLGEMTESPGYRRHLRSRIAAWTRQQHDPAGPPPGRPGSPIDGAEWAVYGAYRRLLTRAGAEDAEGFAWWASRHFAPEMLTEGEAIGRVLVLDPPAHDPAVERVLAAMANSGELDIDVGLSYDPRQAEAFSGVEPLREALVGLGFEAASVPARKGRNVLLGALEARIFRDDEAPKLETDNTITARGAPRGEGLALEVARLVRERVKEGPEQVAVLVPRWDDQAELILQTLGEWALPAWTDQPRRLDHDPAVAALVRAMRLPVEGWNAEALRRLLRNGQVRPDWATESDRLEASQAIAEAGALWGLDQIVGKLREAEGIAAATTPRVEESERFRRAGQVLERLGDLLESGSLVASWADHAAFAGRIASELALDAGGGLEALQLALDEVTLALEALGRADVRWHRERFIAEVEALGRELTGVVEPPPGPSVLVTTPERAAGLGFRHVVLANLAEGTFPAREAIQADPPLAEGEAEGAVGPGYAREMLRFLRVLGTARETLALVYPTADEKGQVLLQAGFLDELAGVFTPGSWAARREEHRRLTPVPEEPLCGSARERRVRAVVEAAAGHPAGLRDLARTMEHRAALEGTARAVRIHQARALREGYGAYEGMLGPSAARLVAARFGAGRPTFSPSQLESYAFCPFQFFLKHVLRLKPLELPDEFEEEARHRGSVVHSLLEMLHARLRDVPPENPDETMPDRVRDSIVPMLEDLLGQQAPTPGEVGPALDHIRAGRYERTARRYTLQFKGYHDDHLPADASHSNHLEIAFGSFGHDSEHPPLTLGGPDDGIDLQGRIDRVEVFRYPDGLVMFRVIDYKTGGCPSRKDVETGQKLQLPLYAIAVERVLLAGEAAVAQDVGYWGLRGKGFKVAWSMVDAPEPGGALAVDQWVEQAQAFETYALELAAGIRDGRFPVAPVDADNCEGFCEFREVCRIRQVRAVGKDWDERPGLTLGGPA